MTPERFAVVIVYSTSHALRAEKVVQEAGIDCKLIPVPRQMSSDCGVCVRIPRSQTRAVRRLLKVARVEFEGIHNL
jgi:hypothetical protein